MSATVLRECWLEIAETGEVHLAVWGGLEHVELRELSLAGIREAYAEIMQLRKEAEATP